MAVELGVPVLGDWGAAKYLCQDVTENVAKDEGHDGPCEVSEFGAHAKNAEVEEKNREFVS